MSERTPRDGGPADSRRDVSGRPSADGDAAPGTEVVTGSPDAPGFLLPPGGDEAPTAEPTVQGPGPETDDSTPVSGDSTPVSGPRRGRGPWWAPGVVSPSREDPLVRAASPVVGGPAGTRLAGATGMWRAASVLMLFALALSVLALVEKQHCRAEGWGAPDDYWHACYSDLPAVFSAANLNEADRPGPREVVRSSSGQPPAAAFVMWASSVGIHGRVDVAALRFFDVSVLLLTMCLFVAVAALVATAGRRAWDAAHLAAAPMLVTVAFLNYELLAIALLCLSLFAWTRRRPVVAGVLLGLASAIRPVYLVVGFAVLALALRSGRWRPCLAFGGLGAAVWMAVRLPLEPGVTGGLTESWRTWKTAGPGYGSVWMVPNLLAASKPPGITWWIRGKGLSASTATALALLVLVVVLVAVLLLVMTAPRRPRLAHLGLILLVGVLLASKSLPPQASLLVLPFLALSALRWRDHLIWAFAEVAYFVGVWMHIAAASDPNKGLPAWSYLVLLVVRAAALGWLAVQAVRAVRDPERDPVRTPVEGPAGDDPHGAHLDGAPDALLVRLV